MQPELLCVNSVFCLPADGGRVEGSEGGRANGEELYSMLTSGFSDAEDELDELSDEDEDIMEL